MTDKYEKLREELMSMTVKEIKAYAKEHGVVLGYDGARKASAVDAIVAWIRHNDIQGDDVKEEKPEKTDKHDVVYILKNKMDDAAELRYSIRSVVENFPYRNIVFAGGRPFYIEPDYHFEYRQVGKNKWERVNKTILALCHDPEISDDFWLFNDDFFIMKPWEYGGKPLAYKTLDERIAKIEENNAGLSNYSKQLQRVVAELRKRELPTKNYCLHVPMLVNKKKAIEVIMEFEGVPMFRSLYGNYALKDPLEIKDVKVKSNDVVPDDDCRLLSTMDGTFVSGRVGEFIRERFQQKSRYEHD